MSNPTVRSEGAGRHTIVFIHGFPLDATLWAEQRALASRAQVISFDLPGFGAAAALPASPTIGSFAEEVRHVLDAQRVDRAVLCGLSMGGYILFECWRRFPGRIAGIVLADTRAEADADEARDNRDAAIAQIQGGGRDELAEGMIHKLISPLNRGDEAVITAVRGMMARASAQGLIAALTAMRDRPDSTETLSSVDVPALTLVGRDDELTPPDLARTMANRIAGCRLVEIPDAGHLSPLENPQAFNEALADWMALLP